MSTTYTIHFTDGTPDVVLTHPPPPSITHQFNSTSCGYSCNGFANAFCATITAQNPCASSFAIVGPIYVSSQAGTNFVTNPANIGCSNAPVTITNTSTAASINNNGTCTTTSPSYWTITPGGYTVNSGQLGTAPCNNNPANWGSPNLNVTFPPGTYDITLHVCSPCGDSIVTKTICITDPPSAQFTLNPIRGCKPLAVTANNTSSPTTGCSVLTYNWTVVFTPSPCSITPNGNWAFTNGTNASSLNPEFIFNDAGTYTVTLTASNGCNPPSISSQDVIVTAPPSLVINPIADSCGVSCVQPVAVFEDCGNSITSYSWTFAGCIGASTSSSQNPPLICYPPNTGLTPIVYTINCLAINNCGSSINASQTFTIYPIPSINNSVADLSGSVFNDGIICNGDNATINANGSGTFTWAPASGLSSTTGTPVNATPSVTTTYTVTIVDANGCTATATQLIAVNTLPLPAITETDNSGITINDLIICSGDNATLDAGSWSNYQWSNGATSALLNISGLTSTATYTVTVTDFNGCSNSANSTITVNQLPAPVITGLTTVCSGAPANLDAGTGPGWTYLWSDATSSTTQTINPTSSGTYTVTVTDANGCSASNTVNVIVGTNPNPSITGVNIICNGDNTTFDAGGIGLGWSYSWSTGATLQNINITSPYSSTYTVTVTDLNGCTGSNAYNLTVNPLPTPSINGVTSICSGEITTLCGNAGYSGYVWSTGPVTSCISNITTAGNYTLTVTDGNGCTASVTQTVIVNPLPSAVILGAGTICPGGSTTLSAPAGNTYLWSTGAATSSINVYAGGTFTVTVTSPQGCTSTSAPFAVNVGPASASINAPPAPYCTGSPVVLSANPGISWQWSTGETVQNITVGSSGTFTVTVTQGGGCTASTSQALTFYAPPVPVINGPISICQNLPFVLDAGPGYSTYLWTGGYTTQTISPVLSGTYTVTVTNANGCTASVSQNLTINAAPNPSIAGITSICQGNSTALDAGSGYINYIWSTGANTQSINAFTSGYYTVTVTSLNGCTASTSLLLTVNPLPTPTISGVTAICGGANANLDAGIGYVAYQWSTGASTQTISPSLVGTYVVTVTDNNGCSGNTSVYLSVTPNPVPVINGVASVCQGSPALLTASPGYLQYLWSSGVTVQAYSPPTVTPGTYTVTVTDINGCTGSVNYSLAIDPLPTPTITGGNGICLGDSIQLNAGAGFTTYQWNTGANSPTIYVNSPATYTVTVTGMNGCSNSASLTLITYSLPAPTISGVTSICSGSASNLDAGAGYVNYLWSNGYSTQVITPSNAGVYTVTVTDGNGCSATTTASVSVQSNPVPVITGNNVVCQNGTTTFDAGAGYVSYLWNTAATTQTLNPSTTTSGIYTVTVTDINGCSGTATYNLTVNSLPTPSITGNSTICADTVSVLDAGSGYIIYNWNTGVSSQSITANSTGTYTVTVTDGNGCTGTASATLLVNPLPSPSISGLTVVCAGASANLDATPGFNAYLWSDGSVGQSIFPIATGNYTVTVTDANGCTASVSAGVTVNNNPAPVIIGDNFICQGDLTFFDAGAGFQSYTWSNGINTQLINLTAAGTYTVTVTDVNGCTGTSSYVLTVNPLPTPSIAGGNSICQGQVTNLDAGSGYINYAWNTGASSQVISTGNGATYIVTVTDVNNCSATTSVTLVVNPLPVPVISGINTICDGNTSSLTASGGVSYQWSTGSTNQVINAGLTGIYVVTVTDANGCSDSTNFSLTVNPNPTPMVSGLDTICTGQTAQLSVDSGYVSYSWNTGATTPSIYPALSGTYSVTVTDANGCTGTSPDKILFVDVPVATITPLGPVDFCTGESVTLTANNGMYYYWSNGATSQTINVNQSGTFTLIVIDNAGCDAVSSPIVTQLHEAPYVNFSFDSVLACGFGVKFNFINKSLYEPGSTFNWNFGDGYFDSVPEPIHYFNATGNYIVSLTITTPYGCIGDTTFSIHIDYPPMPIPLFSMSRDLVPLFDGGVQFINESQDATSWLWTFSSEVNSIEPNPIYYFDEEGSYPIKLTAFNRRGCSNEIIKSVTVAPFWLPKAFTPNGDRVNESFFTSNYVFDVLEFEMSIYNRWADLVYRTDSFNKPWDGSAKNGGVAPIGTYVYVIKVTMKTGRKREFTGLIDLIR